MTVLAGEMLMVYHCSLGFIIRVPVRYGFKSAPAEDYGFNNGISNIGANVGQIHPSTPLGNREFDLHNCTRSGPYFCHCLRSFACRRIDLRFKIHSYCDTFKFDDAKLVIACDELKKLVMLVTRSSVCYNFLSVGHIHQ